MSELLAFLSKRRSDMLQLGLEHIAIVGVSVLLCSVIGVALGVATYRTDRPREIVLAVTSTFLTIPSFALFILLIGPLGIGALPVVVALTMYGLLPTCVRCRRGRVCTMSSAVLEGASSQTDADADLH